MSEALIVNVTFCALLDVSTRVGLAIADLITGGVVSGVEMTVTVFFHALFQGLLPPVGE